MVPNAWLTSKMVVPRAYHVNLIIAFAMHSISMPESFISMRCCFLLAIKISIPWIMELNQAHVLRKGSSSQGQV